MDGKDSALSAGWVQSDQKQKAKILWTKIQQEPAEETTKWSRGLYLGTSSLQSVLHSIYVYTFCSQQASAVSDCCHLLLSQTSKLLPTLTEVGHSQVGHWAFLCVAGEEEVAVIIPLTRRICCGDSVARKGLKCWNRRLRSRAREGGTSLCERGRGQQWSNKQWSQKDFAQSMKGNSAGSFLPPCKRGTSTVTGLSEQNLNKKCTAQYIPKEISASCSCFFL